ncbi:hypothetical protein BDE36_1770 [Arcticibacter tournemirensis]|uniref:DUF3592 domain-containing protein n=1 Tax=Arcticibacter tournemirensis TaxID=699437 RepID=A0A5M9HEJ8_9SPHI|nr:hypothetical protein [Arcticibacter tournemirensis]KAA8483764.1 hypothetical protein F1649_07705 [Arcticibacter tournemirensis]TQM50035.1 hypothetical protein BDE36_1770 [Arcticibacter tournemirensis]
MKRIAIVAIAATSLLYASCVTERACNRKFPPQTFTKDSIIERTTVEYRDTTIYDTVPGEQVKVYIPAGASGSKSSGHVHLRFKARDGGTEVECVADSLIREIKARNQVIDRLKKQLTEHQIVKYVSRVPWYVWVLCGAGWFCGMLFAALYLIRIRSIVE